MGRQNRGVAELPPYVTAGRDDVFVDVFVQPRAAKDEIVGTHGDALKVKVRAVPEQGRANRAVESMVAGILGIRPSAVSVTTGATSRHKRLKVAGPSAETVACELTTVLSSRAHEPGKEADQAAEQDHGEEGHP